jgi:hypothetical protein
MTNTLFDYEHGLVQQHIDDLRRDAAKARLSRAARLRRRARRAAGGRATLRLSPAR